ncbi:MAG TPA: hypothetical protein VH481_08395 [Nitrososphaeraceae archaeon]
MNNILHGIASVTDPRNIFLADNACRNRCQTAATPSARSSIIH